MFITVDSNVLLSVFANDSLCNKAVSLLGKYKDHEYIINNIIYIELGLHFEEISMLDKQLLSLEISTVSRERMNFTRIVNAWKTYLKKRVFTCPNCGNITGFVCPVCNSQISYRQRILADFLIADFALEHSDGIITFDPNYYKNYFPEIRLFE